jgi:hypothetical protein
MGGVPMTDASDYDQWLAHVASKPHEPMTQAVIDEAYRLTRVYGPANSWSGTTGSMAAMILELLRERHELLRLVRHHEKFVRSMGYVGPKWGEG